MMAMEVPSQPGLNPKRCLRLAYGTAQRVSRLPKMPIEPFNTIHEAVAILCSKVRIYLLTRIPNIKISLKISLPELVEGD